MTETKLQVMGAFGTLPLGTIFTDLDEPDRKLVRFIRDLAYPLIGRPDLGADEFRTVTRHYQPENIVAPAGHISEYSFRSLPCGYLMAPQLELLKRLVSTGTVVMPEAYFYPALRGVKAYLAERNIRASLGSLQEHGAVILRHDQVYLTVLGLNRALLMGYTPHID